MERHIRKLEDIKEKRRTLQEEESRIKMELTKHLAEFLIDSGAFDHIEFDIITGGILDVVDRAKTDAGQSEVWKKSGVKFRKSHSKKKGPTNPKSAKTS